GYFPALLRALEYTSRLARTNASNLIAARTTSGRLSGCGNVLLRQQPRAAREVARHLLRAIRVLLTEFFAERVLRRPGVRALVRERAVRRQRHAHVEQKVRDVAGDVLLTVFLTCDYDATDFVGQPRFPGLEYLVVQLVEWQGALTQHLIVERADVELRAQLPLRIATQRFYLELSTLVRQCLRRHHDVAIDFLDYVLLRLGAVRLEVVDRLLSRPAERVNPGVDHQSDCSPNFISKLPEFGVRILVQPELRTETLGIQSPPFDESGVTAVAAEIG